MARTAPAGSDLLKTIFAARRRALSARRGRRPAAEIERGAAARTPKGGAFVEALRAPERCNVVAECKSRSPSRGVIRKRYRPGETAAGFAAAGAAAVSVLTEPAFFGGELAHLAEVRRRIRLPLLQKDFIFSERQLVEGCAAGADAALLIVAALDDAALRALARAASALGLAVVMEAHDRDELDRAVGAGAEVIGVNNRDLRTLEVDRARARELVESIPEGVVAVAESGLRDPLDLRDLRRAGYDAFLIGEALMRRPRPGRALARMLAEAGPMERGARRGEGRRSS